jgi:hypothetical protein
VGFNGYIEAIVNYYQTNKRNEMTVRSIQGSASGPYYVMDNSQGQGARVCAVYATLREAQRATLNTTDALAFDAGATYTAPPQGDA